MANASVHSDIFGSLTTLSTEALKFSGLINAGAAVIVIANLKDLALVVPVRALLHSVEAFAVGALCCAFAYAMAYLTNLRLLQEENDFAKKGGHKHYLRGAIFSFMVSIAAFGYGSISPLSALVDSL